MVKWWDINSEHPQNRVLLQIRKIKSYPFICAKMSWELVMHIHDLGLKIPLNLQFFKWHTHILPFYYHSIITLK